MKRFRIMTAAAVACGIIASSGHRAPAAQTLPASADYIVVLEDRADRAAAIAAIDSAGGTIVSESTAIQAFAVTTSQANFGDALAHVSGIVGAARNEAIGRSRAGVVAPPKAAQQEDARHKRLAATVLGWMQRFFPFSPARLDPLDADQWNLKMVKSDRARKLQAGRKEVLVGILDSGVDSTHPDLVQNYDMARSRNFVRDIPFDENGSPVDGPCEVASCVDPVGRDDLGIGTFDAGVVAAAANGFGISGVAPRVTLVDIRVAQDSGYVFLQPFVNGLTYAADTGVDVVTMGFSLDPWVFNCTANPADSAAAQAEQRTVMTAVERALQYAHRKGVTLIGSVGNGHTDLGNPSVDTASPTYPSGAAYPRSIDNATCAQLPVEGSFVIGVSALGPSEIKADYSNYGLEQTSLSAPGGWFRDYFGTPQFRTNENMVLSTVPRNVLLAEGLIDPDDNVTDAGVNASVVKYCSGTVCAYYQRMQSAGIASAHAAGVAALVVSQFGSRNASGWGMAPDRVERVLFNTASERPCPTPRVLDYLDEGRPAEFTATCEGDVNLNGFYGHGIVDAVRAITLGILWAF